MAAISNDFSRFRIVNLHDDTPGRGPFVVTQHGSNPGDPLLTEDDYVLGRRGEWIRWIEIFGAAPGLWEEVVFGTIQEVIAVVENLTGLPVVRAAMRPAEEVLAQLCRVEANGGIREEIRRMLRERIEHKAKP